MIVAFRNLAHDESGGALVEYALVLSLLSLVAMSALTAFGAALEQFFATSSYDLTQAAVLAQ